MNLKLNPNALQHALDLMTEGKYRINSVWRENKPTPAKATAYDQAHGAGQSANWYLAIDTDAPEGSPERYSLPYGDFDNVHQTALNEARHQAAGNDALIDGIDQLLEQFDLRNAC